MKVLIENDGVYLVTCKVDSEEFKIYWEDCDETNLVALLEKLGHEVTIINTSDE